MDARDWLELEASSMTDQENKRIVCPKCRGGSSKEVSMSLTKDGPLVRAYCFRASCGAYFILGSKSKVEEKKEKPRPQFTDNTYPRRHKGMVVETVLPNRGNGR